MEPIHICFCVTDNLFEQLCVTMVSIMENTKSKVCFHVFSNDLTEAHKKDLETLRKKYGFGYETRVVGKTPFSTLDLSKTRFTEDIFNRLLIPQLLPGVKKAIYLDVDIVVRKDIKEYYDINLGENYLGAVPEVVCGVGFGAERYVSFLTGIGLKVGDAYCNSGSLLINCDKIRKDGITQKFVDNAHRLSPVWRNPDQDVMNITCFGKIQFIDRKFNFIHSSMARFPNETEKAVVLHFVSANKPWFWFANYPEMKYWIEYGKKTREALGLQKTVDEIYVLTKGYKECLTQTQKQNS